MKVRVGDIDIFYRFDGPEDGPPVMLAHALGTSHLSWDRQMPAPTDRYPMPRELLDDVGSTGVPT